MQKAGDKRRSRGVSRSGRVHSDISLTLFS